jgi:Protein of unknown function (DUF1217)
LHDVFHIVAIHFIDYIGYSSILIAPNLARNIRQKILLQLPLNNPDRGLSYRRDALYYNAITRDYSKTLAATAAEPAVSQQTKYFLANIGNVKTANDLINNSKLYTDVMKAFGLSDMMNAKGLIRQVLEGGVASPKSLVKTLVSQSGDSCSGVCRIAEPDGPLRGAVAHGGQEPLSARLARRNVRVAMRNIRMTTPGTSGFLPLRPRPS